MDENGDGNGNGKWYEMLAGCLHREWNIYIFTV